MVLINVEHPNYIYSLLANRDGVCYSAPEMVKHFSGMHISSIMIELKKLGVSFIHHRI